MAQTLEIAGIACLLVSVAVLAGAAWALGLLGVTLVAAARAMDGDA